MQNTFELSVVIPLLNEEESLASLHKWIVKALERNASSYELIFIDDGSTDGSWNLIKSLARAHKEVKGMRFARNYGKS